MQRPATSFPTSDSDDQDSQRYLERIVSSRGCTLSTIESQDWLLILHDDRTRLQYFTVLNAENFTLEFYSESASTLEATPEPFTYPTQNNPCDSGPTPCRSTDPDI